MISSNGQQGGERERTIGKKAGGGGGGKKSLLGLSHFKLGVSWRQTSTRKNDHIKRWETPHVL
jgi:hypothetical protein